MSQSRLEWKVGLFVFVGLALMAALLLQFSKGASLWLPSYDILLDSPHVSGLKNRADVKMAGVKVGSVSDIALDADGKSVAIRLTIYSKFRIFKDARFVIEQAGFLGDQYIGIYPTENQGGAFQDGDKAEAEAPFNLQEVAKSATGLVERVEDTARSLNAMMDEMRKHLLNAENMTNVSVTVSNLRAVSERAVGTVESLNSLLRANGPAISASTSNLMAFSVSMRGVSDSLTGLMATNEGRINSAISNVEASSASLRGLMSDVEQGKGLAGSLIKNEELSDSVSRIANNLSITSSNLNRLGLWGIMWSRKEAMPQAGRVEKLPAPKDANRSK
jgi:phospholipid/cholesterol/gamma-HCH transport system substrate-binding protein